MPDQFESIVVIKHSFVHMAALVSRLVTPNDELENNTAFSLCFLALMQLVIDELEFLFHLDTEKPCTVRLILHFRMCISHPL